MVVTFDSSAVKNYAAVLYDSSGIRIDSLVALDTNVTTFSNVSITGVNSSGESPTGYFLGQNYPNPFNPSSRIAFTITISAIAYSSGISTEIDSISSAGKGRFVIGLGGQKHHAGLYRISFNRNKWIDIVNDGEDVTIETDASALLDNLKIVTSESNRLYYSFLRLNKEYKTKTDLLQLVLARYPKDDPYYKTTQTTVTKLQKEYSAFVSTTSQQKPNSFIARYIRSARLPVVDFNQPVEKQLTYLKSHSLDHVDFTDDRLINSDLFASKSIEYLMYYRNPQLPKELLQREFMTAVDTILSKAKVNQPVYQHIAEYLIDGFKKFGFEECISYILDNYVIKDDLCLNEQSGSSIQRMLEQKKMLPAGATAPNFLLPDASGKMTGPAATGVGKTLIVFYSTSCPHCRQMMPRLAGVERGKVNVIAVSLDSSRTDWLSFIRSHNLNHWSNVIDPKLMKYL